MTINTARYLPWLMPVLAAIAAGYLLIREIQSEGETITLHATVNPGLEVDVSELRFRGVACGRVTAIRLDPEASRVDIEITTERWAEHLARKGSRFWVVTPRLEVGRVRGLDALRTGAYITVSPGDGEPQTTFEMLPEAPAVPLERAGQRYHVFAHRTHGIQPGAPIYYRGMTIGTVAQLDLVDGGSAIRLALHIDRPYVFLMRKETKFWPAVAFRADIGLLGGEVETGTLESFWSGGIEIATPPESTKIEPNTVYWMSPKPEDDWREWEPKL